MENYQEIDYFIKKYKYNENKVSTFERKDTKYEGMIEILKKTIIYIVKVIPYCIMNNVRYDELEFPKHWGISNVHEADLMKIVRNQYETMMTLQKITGINDFLKEYIKMNQEIRNKIEFIRIDKKKGLTAKLIYYNVMDEFFTSIQNLLKTQEIMNDSNYVKEDSTKKSVFSTIVEHMSELYFTLFIENMEMNIVSYHDIALKMNKLTNDDREQIKKRLNTKSDDERNIEFQLKKNKLGDWNVGMQKGLREYDEDYYDNERIELEKRMKLEKQMGNVAEQFREVYMDKYEQDKIFSDFIEIDNDVLLQEDGDDHGNDEVFSVNDIDS